MADHATRGDGRLRLFVGVGRPRSGGDGGRGCDGLAPRPLPRCQMGAGGEPARHPGVPRARRQGAAPVDRGPASGRWRPRPRPSPPGSTGVGGFPSMAGGAGAVGWASTIPETDAGSSARAVQEALSPTFPEESRPFTPHLTVARSPRSLDLRGSGRCARHRAERFDVAGSRCSEAISAGPSPATRSSRPSSRPSWPWRRGARSRAGCLRPNICSSSVRGRYGPPGVATHRE